MRFDFSTDRVAGILANGYLAWNSPGMPHKVAEETLPSLKYNVLVTAFNASTTLLVAAAVLPVFWGFSAAVVVGAAGLFLRTTVLDGLNAIAAPYGVGHASQLERLNNIFASIAGASPVLGWKEDDGLLLGHVVWKNLVPVMARAPQYQQ